jgi:hypothetical protein
MNMCMYLMCVCVRMCVFVCVYMYVYMYIHTRTQRKALTMEWVFFRSLQR